MWLFFYSREHRASQAVQEIECLSYRHATDGANPQRLHALFSGTPVAPRLTGGYAENERFRQVGVVSYGFSPYTATPQEGASEHGDNERIRIEELRRGLF